MCGSPKPYKEGPHLKVETQLKLAHILTREERDEINRLAREGREDEARAILQAARSKAERPRRRFAY